VTSVSIPTHTSASEPSPGQGRAAAAPSERARGIGPVVLILPICALLVFALWRQAGGGATVARSSTERPPSARGERVVDGWAGSFTVPGAAPFVVEARLAPLHAVPERQAFDAAALARRLDLPQGEPWRLTLTARTNAALGQVEGAPVDAPRPAPLPLSGLALSGFQELAERGSGPGSDPLRTLVAPPDGGLGPGQRVDLLYWRPLPSGAVADGAGEPSACTLSAALVDTTLQVVLTPTRLAEPDTSASLARLPKTLREERGR
jgi:hypothetical protein